MRMMNAPWLLSGSVSSQRGRGRETEGRQTEPDKFYPFLLIPQGLSLQLWELFKKKLTEKEMCTNSGETN